MERKDSPCSVLETQSLCLEILGTRDKGSVPRVPFGQAEREHAFRSAVKITLFLFLKRSH